MKTFLACALLILAGCSTAKQEAPSATVFEGARLITGDGSAPVENSAFVMENAKITAVGRKGEITAPAVRNHRERIPSLLAAIPTVRHSRE